MSSNKKVNDWIRAQSGRVSLVSDSHLEALRLVREKGLTYAEALYQARKTVGPGMNAFIRKQAGR